MGIKDLLKFMKPYIDPIHIKKYSGKRVGIDAYSWLHKGAYSCSMEICLNLEGDKKFQYINYCMHRIDMLRHHNISPVLVFDGCNIPCKSLTEQDRHSKRKSSRDLAMAKLNEGNVSAATEMFQRAVSITPSMAHQLIQVLESENIEFVVAPYEADAQLAYLCGLDEDKGGISAVISEDSDLLAYGCSSVIFKMDRYGNGEEIAIDKVFDSVGRVPSFRLFNKQMFTGMCVLAGCDFLPSVPGIGIAKAYGLVSKYQNLDRVLSVLKYEKGNLMPEDYFKSFKEAFAVFQHARIYDAYSKKLKHLTPLTETLLHCLAEELDFLGPEISSSQATAIAEGKLDPSTMKGFNELPSFRSQRKPIAVNKVSKMSPIQPLKRVSKQEAIPDNCFTVVSSQKTGTKRITVIEQEPKSNLKQFPNLKKLISPLKNVIPSRADVVPAKRSSEVPNNNPFKRRKETAETEDFVTVTQQQSEVIEVIEVIEVEDLELVCTEVDSCTSKCITDQHSGVTEVEDLEILCFTPSSQKSVESRSTKKTGGKKAVRSGKKVESIPENKKNTILNFFSRV